MNTDGFLPVIYLDMIATTFMLVIAYWLIVPGRLDYDPYKVQKLLEYAPYLGSAYVFTLYALSVFLFYYNQ